MRNSRQVTSFRPKLIYGGKLECNGFFICLKYSIPNKLHCTVCTVHMDDDFEDREEDCLGYREASLESVYVFGSMEDGRTGVINSTSTQSLLHHPHPIDVSSLSLKTEDEVPVKFCCELVACGARHSLLLLKNCFREEFINIENGLPRLRRRKRILVMTGLNQRGLCEDPGFLTPVIIPWGEQKESRQDSIASIAAGDGTSFVVTVSGRLFSWGNGGHGRLGHGDLLSLQSPRQCLHLKRHIVRKIATGGGHAVALTNQGVLFSWGHNHRGQVGVGSSSKSVLEPTLIPWKSTEKLVDMSCGDDFTLLLVKEGSHNDERTLGDFLYGWGACDRGQLGGDHIAAGSRNNPVEIAEIPRLLHRIGQRISSISAGGAHCLASTYPRGQVISWGAGNYGIQ